MRRWLGIDYGTRRIGLALSDHSGRIASPAATISASGTPSADARAILDWAGANEAAAIVVGLPLNMDGSEGAQAKLCKELAKNLAIGGNLPVELWDERLTSFEAEQLMAAAGVKPRRRRRLRDALAAQVILQSFLDARCEKPPNSSDPPGSS
jgi:putative Holliday junction resolvase